MNAHSIVINTISDCPDGVAAKIMWVIDGMEDYAAADNELADLRGRIKHLLIDQWIRFDLCNQDHRHP